MTNVRAWHLRPVVLAAMALGSIPGVGCDYQEPGDLAGEEIIIRSTGCPNGCARPYMAEIAFVGKAPGRYQLWLGGNSAGTTNADACPSRSIPSATTSRRSTFAKSMIARVSSS